MMMLSRSWTLGSRKGSLRSVSPSDDHLAGGARVPSTDGDRADSAAGEEDRWSMMLPELMREIVRRVEASEKRWPPRSSVVSCACVCRRWRDITTSIVRSPSETGMITFPSSLKQPGPKGQPIQCFIKRNKRNSTFFLYLSLTQMPTDRGKFLLAARRIRHGAHTEYIISLDADDISQGSNAYVGKLRSDFFGTKFTIYDVRPPFDGVKPSSCRSSRRISSKRISPQVPVVNFEIGQVGYQFNLLKSRGPRRMLCTVQRPSQKLSTPGISEDKQGATLAPAPVVALTNKAPRWHQHLQCWCLNFHGRVTVASVKNFQLVCPSELEVGDEDSVLLQFGKFGDDLFTMDYRQPLSAFQAFAICLSSFGTKFACE